MYAQHEAVHGRMVSRVCVPCSSRVYFASLSRSLPTCHVAWRPHDIFRPGTFKLLGLVVASGEFVRYFFILPLPSR